MQAKARANRVSEGKSNGLIVDYIGVVKALRQALADYTRDPDEGKGDEPVYDKDELGKLDNEEFSRIGYRKGKVWSFEDETRIVLPLLKTYRDKKQGLYFCPISFQAGRNHSIVLKAVICGPAMKVCDKAKIKRALDRNKAESVGLLQGRLQHGRFLLEELNSL